MELTTTPIIGFIFGGLEGLPLLAGLILAIVATVRVCKRTDGPATPLWIFLIWILPFVGAIVAIVVTKPRAPTLAPPVRIVTGSSNAVGGLEPLGLDHKR